MIITIIINQNESEDDGQPYRFVRFQNVELLK